MGRLFGKKQTFVRLFLRKSGCKIIGLFGSGCWQTLKYSFLDFARKEVVSNSEAHKRFLNSFTKQYGPPLGGPEILEIVLNGKMILPSNICISACEEFSHCPIINILNYLITGGLNPELIDASNKIVARALVS